MSGRWWWHSLLVIFLCCRLGLVMGAEDPAEAAAEAFPEQARQAAAVVEQICTQYLDLKGHTTATNTQINTILATNRKLQAAVAGGDPSQAIAALKLWEPDWADHLETLTNFDEVRQAIARHGIAFPGLDRAIAAGEKLEDVTRRLTLAAAEQAARQTDRVATWIESSGVQGYLEGALHGDHALGKAIKLGEQVQQAHHRLVRDYGKQAKAYLDAVQQFRRQEDNVYAGMETIVWVLNTFKDKAPPPMDALLGAYADVTAGIIKQLKALEQQIDKHIRQGVITANLQDKNTVIVEALQRQFPDEDPYQVFEVGSPPEPFSGRYFRSTQTGWSYLFTDDKHLYRFTVDDATVTRVAGWVGGIRGPAHVHPGVVSAWSRNLRNRLAEHEPVFAVIYQRLRATPWPLIVAYTQHVGIDLAQAEQFQAQAMVARREAFDDALARFAFDGFFRSEITYLDKHLRRYALIEAVVQGDEGLPELEIARLGSLGELRDRASMHGDGAGRYRAWVYAFVDTTIVINGSLDGRTVPSVSRALPPRPCRVEVMVPLPPPDAADEEPDEDAAPASSADEPEQGVAATADDEEETTAGADGDAEPDAESEIATNETVGADEAPALPEAVLTSEDASGEPAARPSEADPAVAPTTPTALPPAPEPETSGVVAIVLADRVEHLRPASIVIRPPDSFVSPVSVAVDMGEGVVAGLAGDSLIGSYTGIAPEEPRRTWLAVTVTDADGRIGHGRIDFTIEPPQTSAVDALLALAEDDTDVESATDSGSVDPWQAVEGPGANHQVAAERPRQVWRDQSAMARSDHQRQVQQHRTLGDARQRSEAEHRRRQQIHQQELAAFDATWDEHFANPDALIEGELEGEFGVLVDAGGFGITNVIYQSPVQGRRLRLEYDCYQVPDKMEVLVNGAVVLITPTAPDAQYADQVGANFASQTGTLRSQPINAAPGAVVVRVTGTINGTAWNFTLSQE